MASEDVNDGRYWDKKTNRSLFRIANAAENLANTAARMNHSNMNCSELRSARMAVVYAFRELKGCGYNV